MVCIVLYSVYSVVWYGPHCVTMHISFIFAPLSNLETGLGHCSWWPEGGRLAPLWCAILDFGAILILYLEYFLTSSLIAIDYLLARSCIYIDQLFAIS